MNSLTKLISKLAKARTGVRTLHTDEDRGPRTTVFRFTFSADEIVARKTQDCMTSAEFEDAVWEELNDHAASIMGVFDGMGFRRWREDAITDYDTVSVLVRNNLRMDTLRSLGEL